MDEITSGRPASDPPANLAFQSVMFGHIECSYLFRLYAHRNTKLALVTFAGRLEGLLKGHNLLGQGHCLAV